MKLYKLIISVCILTGCKVIKPGDKNNVWNAYSDSCNYSNDKYYNWPSWWNPHRGNLHSFFNNKYGSIILTNKDSITGLIGGGYITSRYEGVVILPKGKTSEGELIHFVENQSENNLYNYKTSDEINFLKIYSDSTNHMCHTDFYNLHQKYNLLKYWRLIGKKGEINIYDDFQYEGGNGNKHGYMKKIVMANKSDLIYIYKRKPFCTILGTLRRFVNKRYKYNLNKTHFSNIRQIIDYILEKENENSAK
jgi:hypothetical protein